MAEPARVALRDSAAETVRGIAIVCLSFMLLTVGDIAVKFALPMVGLAGAMLGRAAFGMPTVALVALARSGPSGSVWRRLRPVRWKLVALRSFLHSFVSLTWYVAWQSMTLADTYALGFTVPLLATLLAVPVLGERLRWQRALATLMGFLGVLVMLRPGGTMWTPTLLLFGAGLVTLAMSRLLIRLLSATETAECLSFWLLLAHVPVGLLLWTVYPIDGLGWVAALALLLLGISNGLAHWLQSRAFALAPVGALAPYEYTGLVWATLGGWWVFGELPSRDALIGGAVVAAAGLYNLHRERVRRREEAQPASIPGPPAADRGPLGRAPGFPSQRS